MSTTDFEVHRGIVHWSNVLTGEAHVRIPSLLGAGQLVSIPTTGLTRTDGEMGDEWNVPAAGSSVFVAVSADRTQFLWMTALSTPTDGPTTFNGGIISNSEISSNSGISASNYIRLSSDYDAPFIALTRDGEGTAWIRKETGYVSINALSDDETTIQPIVLDGDVLFSNNALVASAETTNPQDGANVDHIWHNDSSDNGLPGTWHFVSDSTYKNSGSSMIEAGGMRIPTRRGYSGTGNITINSDLYGGSYLEMTSTSTRTVTVTPPTIASGETIPVGTTITVIRYGTGAVNFASGTNTDGLAATIRSRNGDLSLAYQYSAATLICRNTNGADWFLVGDLT